jgi:hypothetical protein
MPPRIFDAVVNLQVATLIHCREDTLCRLGSLQEDWLIAASFVFFTLEDTDLPDAARSAFGANKHSYGFLLRRVPQLRQVLAQLPLTLVARPFSQLACLTPLLVPTEVLGVAASLFVWAAHDTESLSFIVPTLLSFAGPSGDVRRFYGAPDRLTLAVLDGQQGDKLLRSTQRSPRVLCAALAMLADALQDESVNFCKWFLGVVLPQAATQERSAMQFCARVALPARDRVSGGSQPCNPREALPVRVTTLRLVADEVGEARVRITTAVPHWALWEAADRRLQRPNQGLYGGDMVLLELGATNFIMEAVGIVHEVSFAPKAKGINDVWHRARVQTFTIFLCAATLRPMESSGSASAAGGALTREEVGMTSSQLFCHRSASMQLLHRIRRASPAWSPRLFGMLPTLVPWQVACLLGRGAEDLDEPLAAQDCCPWAGLLVARMQVFFAEAPKFLEYDSRQVVGDLMHQESHEPAFEPVAPAVRHSFSLRLPQSFLALRSLADQRDFMRCLRPLEAITELTAFSDASLLAGPGAPRTRELLLQSGGLLFEELRFRVPAASRPLEPIFVWHRSPCP